MSTSRLPVPAAIVIGLDSITGLQSARILAARGIPVVGVAGDPSHPSCRTRACVRIHVTPTHGDSLIATLLREAREHAEPPVLFPCTDLSVLTLSRQRSELDGQCRAVLPEAAVLESLVDKAAFHSYGVSHDLPVANGRVLRDRADLDEACASLRFPCVLKPAVKTPRWTAHTSAKVFRCDTPEMLRRTYARHAPWADRLIVQEWIPGPDTAHYTCNAYFTAGSTAVATFVSQKIRQWPIDGGVGCLSRACRNDEVRDETIRLFQGIGHRGLAYLEMKFDERSGRHLIVEPNVGRPTGRSAAADHAGIALLYTQYCDALGRPLPPVPAQDRQRGRWIYFRQDAQSAFHAWRRGRLTAWQWLRSLRACHRDAVFSWIDPLPFVADLGKALAKSRARRPSTSPGTARRDRRPADHSVHHDIHGVVLVRVTHATPTDLATLATHLGPTRRGRIDRSPDVIVRFVDRLSPDAVRYVEYGRTAYTDEGLLLLRDGRTRVRAQLVLDESGRAEIVCERGTASIPLLLPILSRAALAHDHVALHASAVHLNGVGVLMPAWAHGGKTTGLLAALTQGAQYVGDEWVLVPRDGRRMLGLLKPVELHGWQRAQLPAATRLAAAQARLSAALVRAIATIGVPDRLVGAVDRRLDRVVDPAALFGSACTPLSAPLNVVLCMVRHDAPRVRIERADPDHMATRLAASLASDDAPLAAAEDAWRFAFPDRTLAQPEGRRAQQRELLTQALAGKDLFIVSHPSPCNLRELGAAMASVCRDTARTPHYIGAAAAAPRAPRRVVGAVE